MSDVSLGDRAHDHEWKVASQWWSASHPLCAVSFTLTEYFVRASWLFGLLPRWPWPWSHRTGDQHQPTQVTDHKPQLGSQLCLTASLHLDALTLTA